MTNNEIIWQYALNGFNQESSYIEFFLKVFPNKIGRLQARSVESLQALIAFQKDHGLPDPEGYNLSSLLKDIENAMQH